MVLSGAGGGGAGSGGGGGASTGSGSVGGQNPPGPGAGPDKGGAGGGSGGQIGAMSDMTISGLNTRRGQRIGNRDGLDSYNKYNSPFGTGPGPGLGPLTDPSQAPGARGPLSGGSNDC